MKTVTPAFPWGSGHRVHIIDIDRDKAQVVVFRRKDFAPGEPDWIPGVWEPILKRVAWKDEAKEMRQTLYTEYCGVDASARVVQSVEYVKEKTSAPIGQQGLF